MMRRLIIKRPLLAGNAPKDLSKLNYPVIVSPKYDGIRCLMVNGKAVTRSLKPIPNKFIRKQLEEVHPWYDVDGELIIDGFTFSEISSAVMSEEGKPNFRYILFDTFAPGLGELPYDSRYGFVKTWVSSSDEEFTSFTRHKYINNEPELLAYESKCLSEGYEGVMIRDPKGYYKEGRSTTKEGILLKLKRFEDAEAICIGFTEHMTNTNKSEVNALGLKEKSSFKAGMVRSCKLGSLLLQTNEGVRFEVGTGFTDQERIELWADQKNLVGKIVKFKYQKVGVKNAPRFPVFLGLRDERDL